jgi:hypothetical protein
MGYISETTVMEFESVDKDNRGNFSFAQSLQRLRRTLLGLGNKVIPVYMMNEKHNLNIISNQYGAGTAILYTVPLGKKARVISIETATESVAGTAFVTVSAIVNAVPAILAYSAGDTSGVFRRWDYNDAIELVAGAQLGYAHNSVAGMFIAVTYVEEDVYQ